MLVMGKIKLVQIIFYLVAAVVTNSLLVGNELAAVRHVELYMIGGHVGGHLAATMGDAAIENMEKFHVDKGFIGVHSINFDVGLTSIATPQMQVKRAIFEASKQVFVLADSSKFGGVKPFTNDRQHTAVLTTHIGKVTDIIKMIQTGNTQHNPSSFSTIRTKSG